MQTFLPYSDFIKSAKCLDYKRLGKQRVEAYQLVNVLTGNTNSNAWKNHPACLMWKGHEIQLIIYGIKICDEWISRGYKDSLKEKFLKLLFNSFCSDNSLPPWFGDDAFHASHRSNLLRKDPKFYGQYGWNEPSDLPYIWPTKEKKYADIYNYSNV